MRTELSSALSDVGLIVSGILPVTEGDGLPLGILSVLLLSPAEPSFWPIFRQSPEAQDGMADPLDRWSRRVVDAIAARFGAVPLYPFGGPPHLPFFTWAMRSGRCHASPVRLLVHDRAGLFVSFRAALGLEEAVAPAPSISPCPTCVRPCTTACPVGALTEDGYDVPACKAHVASDAGRDCRLNGCAVRRACPVGAELRLPEQSAFHMEAFL